MEGLPWPTITAASGGWVLFGLLAFAILRALITGQLVTRREADGIEERARKAEKNVDDLIAIGFETTAVGKLQKKVFEAAAEIAPAGDG